METEHPAQSREPQRCADAIADRLAHCLRSLDAFDDGMTAVHVSMALETLKRDYRLDAIT